MNFSFHSGVGMDIDVGDGMGFVVGAGVGDGISNWSALVGTTASSLKGLTLSTYSPK